MLTKPTNTATRPCPLLPVWMWRERPCPRLLFLLASVLAVASSPARADVAVQMQGAVAVSPTLSVKPEMLAGMQAGLTATVYYSGTKVRLDNQMISIVLDNRTYTTMLVNNMTRRYFVMKIKTLKDWDSARDRLMGDTGDKSGNLKITGLTTRIGIYGGHRCRTTTIVGTSTFADSGVIVNVKGVQIDAIDFPNVQLRDVHVAGRRIPRGVLLLLKVYYNNDVGAMVLQSKAIGISNRKLAASTFQVGQGYVQTVSQAEAASMTPRIDISGYLTAKFIDPLSKISESDAIAKVRKLIADQRFDDATTVVRALDRRGLTSQLGAIYNELGDHAASVQTPDVAWGWYRLTVANSTSADEVAHAHFAIAEYYMSHHDGLNAAKELSAIVNLTGVSEADKAKALDLLSHIDIRAH